MERHRYSILVIASFILVSIFAQSKLPLYVRYASWIDLPLIVTLYFGLAYRESIHGMSVGMVVGLLQDALSHGPMGMNGLTKTGIGFLASSISARIEVDHPLIRVAALGLFSVLDMTFFALLEKLFFTTRFSWAHYHFVLTPIANAVVGLPIFILGDHLRKKD